MEYNTNHLGYKLFSGRLKDNRKHSEQLNKFVAGFFDSDGSITYNRNNKGFRQLTSCISQSCKNSPFGKLLRGLQEYYNLGKVYHIETQENHSDRFEWRLNAKDTKVLFNRIGKHLFIKQKHFQSMIDMYDNDYYAENLSELRSESRRVSCSLTHKKHISPAYLAGLIAGDGSITSNIGIERYSKSKQSYVIRNELRLRIELHEMDSPVLFKLKSDYGGKVDKNVRDNRDVTYTWKKSLGKNSADAVDIINNISRFMCLDYKYEQLIKMLNFHMQVAETKRKRLDKSNR